MGKPSKSEKVRHGFLWRGRDKRGVSTWEGNFEMPPYWEFIVSTIVFMFFMYFVERSTPALSLRGPYAWMIIPAGGMLYFGTIWLIADRWCRMLSLSSLKDMADYWDVTEEKLQQLADEKGIEPRYKINGRYLYDPILFAEKRLLLRSSKAPESTELLLHPASATPSEEPVETLLRPTPPPADTSQITLSNPTTPGVKTLQQRQDD
jgi:hypothetical protein